MFERLFGDGGTSAARLAQARERQSILDSTVSDDLRRLLRARSGPSEPDCRHRLRGRRPRGSSGGFRAPKEAPLVLHRSQAAYGHSRRFDEHVTVMLRHDVASSRHTRTVSDAVMRRDWARARIRRSASPKAITGCHISQATPTARQCAFRHVSGRSCSPNSSTNCEATDGERHTVVIRSITAGKPGLSNHGPARPHGSAAARRLAARPERTYQCHRSRPR